MADPIRDDWFVLEVMRTESRSWDWVALMVDVDPDDPETETSARAPRSRWVAIPGKHRDREAACDALEDMLATRH